MTNTIAYRTVPSRQYQLGAETAQDIFDRGCQPAWKVLDAHASLDFQSGLRARWAALSNA